MRAFIVGGAGFVGSHLVDALVARGDEVTVYDDLSNGRREFIAEHVDRGRVALVVANVHDRESLASAMRGHEQIFHLAANPDARRGLDSPRYDLDMGLLLTQNVLEVFREIGGARLFFSSSGTVYGETREVCAELDLGPLPISLYGANKLASEATISGFAECFGVNATVLRFGNVIGPRSTHGAAHDFLQKLAHHPTELVVLGDGRQSKPYLHVRECVLGILFAMDHAEGRFEVFNLAPDGATSVARIAERCVAESRYPDTKIRYAGGDRGWLGDVPYSRLSADKLAARGYRVASTSDAAVDLAIREMAAELVYETRAISEA